MNFKTRFNETPSLMLQFPVTLLQASLSFCQHCGKIVKNSTHSSLSLLISEIYYLSVLGKTTSKEKYCSYNSAFKSSLGLRTHSNEAQHSKLCLFSIFRWPKEFIPTPLWAKRKQQCCFFSLQCLYSWQTTGVINNINNGCIPIRFTSSKAPHHYCN